MDERKNSARDTELTLLLQEQNQKLRDTKKILIPAGLLAAVGLLLTFTVGVVGVILLIVGLVLVVVAFSKRASAYEAIKKLLSERLLPPILDNIFDRWEHKPFDRMPDSALREAGLNIPAYDEVSGSDYIRAVYKGMDVEMSDIELIQVEQYWETVEDADGNTREEQRERRTTVFRGQWLVCDFGKRLAADLLLTEREGLSWGGSTVETESEAFNRRFRIQSEDGHTVFYVLTPHMMEYILAMDEKANGKTYMRFSWEGRLYVAVDTGRDAFEGHTASSEEELEAIRKAYTADIRYFTDLLDELRRNETLFGAK